MTLDQTGQHRVPGSERGHGLGDGDGGRGHGLDDGTSTAGSAVRPRRWGGGDDQDVLGQDRIGSTAGAEAVPDTQRRTPWTAMS